MKRYLPLFYLLLLFWLCKIPNVGIRLSDTNIYFLTGIKLLEGQVLYKDIFFTNFPLLPYIAAIYAFILGKSLLLYYATPLLEISATAAVLYRISYEQTKLMLLAICTTALYLFSFIILSTSDHQTGVFIAAFFATLSYYFYLKKQLPWTGIFMALALLTKAYFLPILLVYLVILIKQKNSYWVNFLLSMGGTGALVLFPTILLAHHQFIQDVFSYSLTRSQGIEKSPIAWFFLQHDFFLFAIGIGLLATIVKNRFLGLVVLFSFLFFLFYQDIYYLYLNFAVSFLCLGYPWLHTYLTSRFSLHEGILPTLLVLFLLYNVFVYENQYAHVQKLTTLPKMVALIQRLHPAALYGVNDITPALSYLSITSLLSNIIDTNANIFRKGLLNSHTLTEQAIQTKALVIVHGAVYPQAQIQEDSLDEIVDAKLLQQSCKVVARFPVVSEGAVNQIIFWQCF